MSDDDGARKDPLYADPQFAELYDANFGPDRADFDFCKGLASDVSSILDLGCGTGALLTALSEGRDVTGVDPADAMLDVARRRPGGERVEWVKGDAQTVRLERRFDLVPLTGHAFQVFLTRQDQADALETIACHLAPGGCFVFDTRNPLVRAWEHWTPEDRQRIEHPEHGRVETWNDVSEDRTTGIVSYETFYRILRTGRTFSTVSQIAFPERNVLEELLDAAGLAVDQWYGDWLGNPLHPERPEIIPLGRLR